jgi:DNA modification methylase
VFENIIKSGTCGMACAMNNFKFVGIEKEKQYLSIAQRWIMAA